MRCEVYKRVSSSGHSLTVNLTRELKAMGLSRGDSVKVTIEKEERDDE